MRYFRAWQFGRALGHGTLLIDGAMPAEVRERRETFADQARAAALALPPPDVQPPAPAAATVMVTATSTPWTALGGDVTAVASRPQRLWWREVADQ